MNRLTYGVAGVVMASITFAFACGEDHLKPIVAPPAPKAVPADALTLHLPRPQGMPLRCVGGAMKDPADLQFAFPETGDGQELFAPANGTARAFAGGGDLGTHLTLDFGGGLYAVLGQMGGPAVGNGEAVVTGELLGTAGCVGACARDRVRFGLHAGDPTVPADQGSPVPFSVYALADDGEVRALAASSLDCASGEGLYPSDLPRNLWHPDGSLLKAPQGPAAYRLDGGRLRRLADDAVLYSLGYGDADVLTVSRDELACYPTGPDLKDQGAVSAGFTENGELWLFVDAGKDRYRMQVQAMVWPDILSSWGIPGAQDLALASTIDGDPRLRWPLRPGFAAFRDGTVVQEAGATYVVSDGAALRFADDDTWRFMRYGGRTVFPELSGTLASLFTRVGSCPGRGCISRDLVASCLAGVQLDWPPDPVVASATTSSSEEGDGGSAPPPARVLRVRWQAPAGSVPAYVSLSGEWRGADGAPKMPWQTDLVLKEDADAVSYDLAGVESGDTFRFSVEYAADGAVSWSCVGPYPAHPTLEGTATAGVDDVPVPLQMNGDPTGATVGCGLTLVVP